MATNKPTKPSITLPTAFGTSSSNVKTPFTPQELIDGYSASIPQVLDGGNLNYMIDALFQYLTWSNAYADWYASGSANTVPYINSSNQLDYATPVFAGSNNTFTGNNTFNGSSTFTGNNTFNGEVTKKLDAVLGTAPSVLKSANYSVCDSNGDWVGGLDTNYNPDGSINKLIVQRKQDRSNDSAIFGVGYNSSQQEEVISSTGVRKIIAGWCIPDYANGNTSGLDTISSGTSYTPTQNGYLALHSTGGHPLAYIHYLYPNTGVEVPLVRSESTDSSSGVEIVQIPVRAGDTYKLYGNGTLWSIFYPLVGR